MRSGRWQEAGIGRDIPALIQADDVNGLRGIELVYLALVRFCERPPFLVIDEEAMPEAVNFLERFAVAREVLLGDEDRHRRPQTQKRRIDVIWDDFINSPKMGNSDGYVIVI